MNLDFLPFKFYSCINNYKRELLFVGCTYYEKYMVFEHTKSQVNSVLGLSVERVELAFKGDKLVNVWLFTNDYKMDDLVNVFEAYFDRKPNSIDFEVFLKPYNGIQFYWGDEVCILGVGIQPKENRAYLYITLKEASLYYIEHK